MACIMRDKKKIDGCQKIETRRKLLNLKKKIRQKNNEEKWLKLLDVNIIQTDKTQYPNDEK